MWRFIRDRSSFFWSFGNHPDASVVPTPSPHEEAAPAQGLKRANSPLHQNEEEEPTGTQKSKRRCVKGQPSPATLELTRTQSIQALQHRLLALKDNPSLIGKGLYLGECANILQPFLSESGDAADAWLSDSLVENYIFYKIAKANQQKNIGLCQQHPTDMTEKNLKGFARRHKEATKIIWPVLEGRHFYLILIGYEEGQVYISALDGFNDKKVQKKHLKTANDLASLLYPDEELQIVASQEIPDQKNLKDCGVVDCYFADHFIEKSVSEFMGWIQTRTVPSDNPNAPYTPYREKIAEMICEEATNLLNAASPNSALLGSPK